MPPMRATADVNVRRGPRLYRTDAGTVIDVPPADVAALSARGFELVEEESSSPTDLASMTVAELRDRAATIELEGRSSMSKAELISALSIPTQQEA